MSFEFGIGEIEIVVASLSYAASVIIATDLLKRVNLTKLVAISAFFQGGILMPFLLLTGASFQFQTEVWFIIILTGGFSGVAFLLYALGLKGIGASLTSVVYSFVGIFSLILGMLFMAAMPGLTLIFPPSLILSSLGGIIAIFGVYLLNRYNGKN
jgi:drug/metabolite transporter (DMT)-like permease